MKIKINESNFGHILNNSEGVDVTSQICPVCGEYAFYSYDYDALYCSNCNVWAEEKCGDPYCEFCSNRPAKPKDYT